MYFENATRFVWSAIVCFMLVIGYGCSDAVPSSQFETTQQAVWTSHDFSRAPAATGDRGNWTTQGVERNRFSGNTYVLGNLQDDSAVSFGCGGITNPEDSLRDVFIVKLDSSGGCLWIEPFGSDRDADKEDRYQYEAEDITLTPGGHPVISYSVTLAPKSGAPYNSGTGSRVVEFDSNGGPVFSRFFPLNKDESIQIEGVDASEGRLVAAGHHSVNFQFAGSTVPDPGSGAAEDALTVAWGELSNGSRPERWAQSWGGGGFDGARDVAGQPGNGGKIAVVGEFYDDYTDLNGTRSSAVRANAFIQVVNDNGGHKQARATKGRYQQNAPIEPIDRIRSADWASDGNLYVAGEFRGDIQSNNSPQLAPNWASQQCSSPPSANDTNPCLERARSKDDYDYFVIKYGSGDLTTGNWVRTSNLNNNNTSSPLIRSEQVYEVTATDNYVAIGGEASNPQLEGSCARYGFAHVFDKPDDPFADSIRPHSPGNHALSNYDEPYRTSGECYDVRAVTNAANYLLVGGNTSETKVNFGGNTQPGGDGFVVGYTF